MLSLKEQVRMLYERYHHLLILSYFIVYLVCFSYLERNVTTHFHVVHLSADDVIPFCEYFIVPYLLWFGYVAWGILHFAFHNKREYYRLCGFLFTGMTVFLVVSTLYPNGHDLRPAYFSHHNFCTTLVKRLYLTDTPTNLFPSIHVYNSVAVHIAVMESREFRENRTIRFGSLLLAVSIILATMFLKQHSVFDVITALLLCTLMYLFIYVPDYSKLQTRFTSRRHFRKHAPQL